MTKRPGAVALAGGALLALLYPGAAAAQGGETFPREVSGGFASWTTTGTRLADRGVSVDVTAPATRSTAADRAWFPATGGGANPETGDADVELAGAAQLSGTARPLALGGLRLELRDGTGTLHTRTVVGTGARELALADVPLGDTAPAVRTGGVTWSGLKASLTEEGAQLLSAWSGNPFSEGDDLGLLDVTVGTGTGTGTGSAGTAPTPPPSRPDATSGPSATPPAQAQNPEKQRAEPAASVARTDLAAGGEQTVTGTGFEPGDIVLVAIDDDTRHQAVADAEGRISQTFPVYATADEGAHTVALSTVTGERAAATRFEVRPAAE
ncbi:HtaA domain-containing protein [Streptomyces sp. YU58]|uniref:HtaA domain-containing protein n=1 Tax=Streptomyces sp. SX92 TaxID=3158972 RepID=UPI0027B98FF9|nr:HtaA domain-containing protein [Streptomyces coralus]WLW51128.1 HtaA domain-containing protein [Streptomyces coralus]